MTPIPYNEVKTSRTGLIENKGYREMLQNDAVEEIEMELEMIEPDGGPSDSDYWSEQQRNV